MVASAPLPTENNRQIRRTLLGIGLFALGFLLLVVGGTYYLYAKKGTNDLEDMRYSRPGFAGGPTTLQQLQATATYSSSVASLTASLDRSSKPLLPGYDSLADGFLPVEPRKFGSLPPATHLTISAIDLDADISELAILNLGDAKAYETPNNVVGHIPESANPGEAGNVWLFGHLESLIRGEGSVFKNLPRIPEMLRRGEHVYIVLSNSLGEYLYQVAATDVLHESKLSLYQESLPVTILVTCVPHLVYDHRLVVTSELVGFRAAV